MPDIRGDALRGHLGTLVLSGMIKAEWEDGVTARRGPRRRVYRLTSKGGRRFTHARDELQQFVATMGRILGMAV